MPIENRIRYIPLYEVEFTRESRQRTGLTNESVIDLALSIKKSEWVNPILINEDNTLMAGERRFTAMSLIHDVANKVPADTLNILPDDYAAIAYNLNAELFDGWTKIPSQRGHALTPLDLMVFEFIENDKRKDLPWQDRAAAVYSIHTSALLSSEERWTAADTARLLSLSATIVSKYLRIMRAKNSNDPKLQSVVDESLTYQSAVFALDRVESRRTEPLTLAPAIPSTAALPDDSTSEKTDPKHIVEIVNPDEAATIEVAEPTPILFSDFNQFAASYSGPAFNFIHCDFPYGIRFNEHAGQFTAADTKAQGSYDDSEEVYWQLLNTLATYKSTLISPSAHLMFWYSQNLEVETMMYFSNHFPEAKLQSHKMIWHCSDNSGLLPDPQRYGRRTYETAMLLTFGDRKIVGAKALSFANPRTNKAHRSQKPIPVLSHFFSMFVDETTRMFDPTCGSASSLIAAQQRGASEVFGIEKDEETYERATKYFKENT